MIDLESYTKRILSAFKSKTEGAQGWIKEGYKNYSKAKKTREEALRKLLNRKRKEKKEEKITNFYYYEWRKKNSSRCKENSSRWV